MFNTTPRQQYRDCVTWLGCQRTKTCSLTILHVSYPNLVSLPFYTISFPFLYHLSPLQNLLVSTHLYILLRIIFVKGSEPLIKIIIEENVCLHGNDVTHLRTKFHLYACCRYKFQERRSKCLRLFLDV